VKGHCLRGMLLGLSLALVLMGGVALAQGISLTTDPETCLECSPSQSNRHWLGVFSSGWQDNEEIDWTAEGPPPDVWSDQGHAVNGEFNKPQLAFFWCYPDMLGDWTFRFEGRNSGLQATFTIEVAEDCSQYEFVPEPGTILLLGSGLAGLAGYATLRWRAKE
jgi:hypothetical protein